MPIKKIQIKNLVHKFNLNENDEVTALNGINLDFELNKITVIIGASSSGKTVLLQHLNGLLLPTSGEVIVDDFVFTNKRNKRTNIQKLRKKIGFLFQFPEQQLFEETVKKDIIFGPLNFGFDKETAFIKAKEKMHLLQLSENFLPKSPLQLSGGEKRKVAIAGIFSYEPDLLVVDQLGRGLDAETKKNFLNLLLELKNKFNKTIIAAAHDMNSVLKIADKIILLEKGKVVLETTPIKLFQDQELCQKFEIEIPKTIKFVKLLARQKFPTNNLE
ncbi:MAG: ATP-binding cassette domain-containing protein [Mollicutes bacterium]|nr:MAG: ATP-binding cassette domain-containing protein [Mollicutes bacterium]